MSELENDYQELADKVNAELAKAAKAIRKATKLVEEAGLEGALEIGSYRFEDLDTEELEQLEEFDELLNMSELTSALSNAGWSISSMRC